MKEERELRGIIKYLVAVSLIAGLAVFVFILLKFRTDSVYDIAMAAFVVIYLVTVIVAYFRVKPILNSSLLDYSCMSDCSSSRLRVNCSPDKPGRKQKDGKKI